MNFLILFTNGVFRNASVILADSGQIYFSDDNKYLLLVLHSGESFENLNRKQQRATHSEDNIPYRRESFHKKQLLVDVDMDFTRYSEDGTLFFIFANIVCCIMMQFFRNCISNFLISFTIFPHNYSIFLCG